MIILLIRAAIYLGTSALGLLVASWVLPDFGLEWRGFIVAVGVFALSQSILTPFIARITNRYVPAALGGIGLISTLVSLVLAQMFPGGLHINGFTTWITAALVIWVTTTLGAILLPLIFLKKRLARRAAGSATPPVRP
ncbi:phage holin family protein [Arthrobacter sp. TMN-49]